MPKPNVTNISPAVRAIQIKERRAAAEIAQIEAICDAAVEQEGFSPTGIMPPADNIRASLAWHACQHLRSARYYAAKQRAQAAAWEALMAGEVICELTRRSPQWNRDLAPIREKRHTTKTKRAV